MTTQQVFDVWPFGNCLQIVPLSTSTSTPTSTPCTTQDQICVQQSQNFLNAIRPGTWCIPAPADPTNPECGILVAAGDFDINQFGPLFINSITGYRNLLILCTFADPTVATPFAIYNLTQVWIISLGSLTVPTITDVPLTCIMDILTPTFNRCQDLNSSAAQQIEAVANSLIDQLTQWG